MADIVSDTLDWAIALFLAFVMLIIFALMIGAFKDREVDTSDIDPVVYLAKVHYSPHILYEADAQTNQPITGLVSREKLSKLDVNNHYENPYIAARFTLLNSKNNPVDEKKVYYNNRNLFKTLESFARNKIIGKGGASYKSYTIPVAYREGGTILRGYLFIEIVRSNS